MPLLRSGRSSEFTADDLLACYSAGVFPMADSRDDERIFLVDPDTRGVVPLRGFHAPSRLARTVRRGRFQIRTDTAFEAVVSACAESRPGRSETWINRPIQALYGELYQRGSAHSIECWDADRIVGGLYGVALGGAFFGESMFSVERDASKIALVHLVARLLEGGFVLLDAQFLTEHLAQFGARSISRAEYRSQLEAALRRPADFYRMPAYADGAAALHAITQAS